MADYLAYPPGRTGPGVLVLHPWWGLNRVIRSYCGRLAESGFVAMAPDYYGGAVATSREEAQNLASAALEKPSTADTVAAALSRLTGLSSPGRPVGVMGFSLGAHFALGLAAGAPVSVAAVVLYYGTGEGDFNSSTAEFLGHFAQDDEFESPAYIESLQARLKALGRPTTFHTYPGTGHWFAEEDRPEHDAAAAALAWARTLAFLRRCLA